MTTPSSSPLEEFFPTTTTLPTCHINRKPIAESIRRQRSRPYGRFIKLAILPQKSAFKKTSPSPQSPPSLGSSKNQHTTNIKSLFDLGGRLSLPKELRDVWSAICAKILSQPWPILEHLQSRDVNFLVIPFANIWQRTSITPFTHAGSHI